PQAGRRNLARQENRGYPQALSPQSSRMRLRPPQRGRYAQARAQQRSSLRPHHQDLPHGKPGEGQNPPTDAAQPQDGGAADGAERGGFNQLDRSADERGRKTQAPSNPEDSPPQGRHARRGAVDPHAEGPAVNEEAGTDFRADGRAGETDRRDERQSASEGR